MSFINYINETVSKPFLALSKEIDKCTKQTHSKLVKELDTAFKDKTITSKEYSELDDKLFDKFKELNNN